jgi:type I restriction enzyme R subunit
MSRLLDALIEQRRQGMLSYKDYLEKIARLTQEATMPGGGPRAAIRSA